MRKFLIIIAAIAVVSVFVSCKSDKEAEQTPTVIPEQQVETMYTSDAEEIKRLSEQVVELLSQNPTYDEGYPTVDDVIARYKMANIAIGWIAGTEAVATDKRDLYEYDGFMYERVRPDCFYGKELLESSQNSDQTARLIYNMKTLECYLATLIGKEDAKEYMVDISGYDMPKFVEAPNGALYAIPYSYPVSGYTDEEAYALSDDGDGTYTFTVNYGVIKADGTVVQKSHDFGFENIDGRWVFTDFRILKQN